MDTLTCKVCSRKTMHFAEDWQQWECSHVDCPHRRHAWSGGLDSMTFEPEPQKEVPHPLDKLFDCHG